uniref:Uncharacterized protein n=1 Tax=Pyxicephalus adspersus TaxID=30357 RepID=A0AAV3ACQ9_PYXAD|nr:TPA: hypothetical protein GDO54_012612 [Pyxicephalus adspersus]
MHVPSLKRPIQCLELPMARVDMDVPFSLKTSLCLTFCAFLHYLIQKKGNSNHHTKDRKLFISMICIFSKSFCIFFHSSEK